MKYMIGATALVAIAGSAWAQDAAPVAQETVWGAAEVDAYVVAHRPRTGSEVADPFAVPAAVPAPADRIILRSPVFMTGTDAPRGDFQYVAVWKYDAATQTMELKTYPPSSGALLGLDVQGQTLPGYASYQRPNVGGIDTFTDRVREDAGEGQNAYGARVQMERITVTSRGVGEVRRSISDNVGPSPGRGVFSYEHKWTIAPEEARTLSQNLELEIIATPVAWAPGKWVICGSDYSGATVRRPTILVSSGCYLTARFQTFRFVDRRDGTVIREWTR